MIKLVALVGIVSLLLLLAIAVLGYYLFRPLAHKPKPAAFHCYDIAAGSHVPLDPPPQAFGVGLSYAAHIEETASKFDPEAPPPIFRKHPGALVRTGAEVTMPGTHELVAAAESLEPGLGKVLREEWRELSALLDYEVEMGFVLLDDVDRYSLDETGFAPRLGFFIGNDVSARTLAILGEGQPNRFDFWGASKSFAGFMPVADRAWVPNETKPDAIPCVVIETTVNGELRQKQSTANLIYTPVQMLRFIQAKYPDTALEKGTIVLMGTPGGVAMNTPRWLARLSSLLGLSRFKKLAAKLNGDTSRFLNPGDRVVVHGQGLGEVSIVITDGETGS
jgi:2-keto-4-pentenoate hydratase/2-oxohepta-3-ene-1,7-dioic acid hydratase in catechol pathway